MRFTHHAYAPWAYDSTRTYNTEPDHKPDGLWFAVDDDWQRWCETDWPDRWHNADRHVELDINLDRVLVLDTVDKVIDFHLHYFAGYGDRYRLPWADVTADYAGIIIAPYQWSLRLDHEVDWYYTWDCASGCIWDLSAIVAVRPYTPPERIRVDA